MNWLEENYQLYDNCLFLSKHEYRGKDLKNQAVNSRFFLGVTRHFFPTYGEVKIELETSFKKNFNSSKTELDEILGELEFIDTQFVEELKDGIYDLELVRAYKGICNQLMVTPKQHYLNLDRGLLFDNFDEVVSKWKVRLWAPENNLPEHGDLERIIKNTPEPNEFFFYDNQDYDPYEILRLFDSIKTYPAGVSNFKDTSKELVYQIANMMVSELFSRHSSIQLNPDDVFDEIEGIYDTTPKIVH